MNNFVLLFISFLILFFSIKIAKGNIVKKPTKNLEELNVNGPILSIPVSWAMNAVPQIKVVIRAHKIENDFFTLLKLY